MINAGRIALASGVELAPRCLVAEKRRDKRRGLLGLERMPAGAALLIVHCRQVHCIGMSFPIDVIFVDRHGRVVRTCESMSPRTITPLCLKARHALEFANGTVARHRIRCGETLFIERYRFD